MTLPSGTEARGPTTEDMEAAQVGDLTSVDGVLAFGGVTDAPLARQRAYVDRLRQDPDLGPVLEPLLADLVARGLA